MQLQTSLFFYKIRFLLAGIIALASLVFFSAIVTAVGSHSILDATSGGNSSSDTPLLDSPNAVTTGAYWLAANAKQASITVGTGFYGGCKAITAASVQAGRATLHGTATVVHGIWTGTTFVASGIGKGFMFTFHTISSGIVFMFGLPGRAIAAITHTNPVSSVIQPASSTTRVPVITEETSDALLARFSAQAQQNSQNQAGTTALLAAQLSANQALDGTVTAGDPAHGGYPAKWDNARQDSMVDSWGMYNRECVSYAAWKVYQTYGTMPYWGGIGNANQWLGNARRAGITTSSVPKVHSVAISMRGYYGHAMWVEKVSGSMVYVSQYNYDLHGHYSEMWVNASYFTYIYFG